MPLQATIFIITFLLLAGFMVAVSFHVYRFRHHHDNSSVVFVTLTVLFILITIFTFMLFDYTPPARSQPSDGNSLLI